MFSPAYHSDTGREPVSVSPPVVMQYNISQMQTVNHTHTHTLTLTHTHTHTRTHTHTLTHTHTHTHTRTHAHTHTHTIHWSLDIRYDISSQHLQSKKTLCWLAFLPLFF